MSPITIKNVNRNLGNQYGRNLAGQAYFRIVWSDDQLEKRFGKFAEYAGKIFLREFSGLREVPKYPYLKGRHVLERWIPPIYAYTPEIPETSQGSYEPVYVYQDVHSRALPINEEVARNIIWSLFHIPLPGHRRSLDKTEDETALEKEIEFNKMVLEEASPYLAGKLHAREAIIVP